MCVGVNAIIRSFRMFALILCIGVVSACSNGDSFNPGEHGAAPGQFAQIGPSPTPAAGKSVASTADRVFSSNSPNAVAGDDYKIAALDVVEVTVLGVPDLSHTYQVASSGTITMPLIETVQAGGKN